MKYFNNLPKILNYDPVKKDYMAMTNLMVRTNLIPEILNNPMLYYTYDIKDSDTPELIAYKYYGTVDRFWLVLYSNQIIDPQWDWPMTSKLFESYISDKYAADANTASMDVLSYTNATIDHYEKVVINTNLATNNKLEQIVILGEKEYTELIESDVTVTVNGSQVRQQTIKKPVSIYDMEYKNNEKKRNIKLIDVKYANLIEEQFKTLMGN